MQLVLSFRFSVLGGPALCGTRVIAGALHRARAWSVTIRSEFCWDPDGRWTGFKQTVKAVTTTLEYRFPCRWTNTIVRLERRYDDSRGSGGGFFKDGQVQPGVVGLIPSQHLLILGVVVTLDSPKRSVTKRNAL
jgi:hypothetical protein